MCEYERFYQFLESRPVRELLGCVHKITDLVGARFQEHYNAKHDPNNGIEDHDEMKRVAVVMANIVTSGFVTPIGMNGFHTKTRRFIRFFPGYKIPISHKTATMVGLKSTSNWFIDKELRVYLKWCSEGYYEMSTKDSERFNEIHAPNRRLLNDSLSTTTTDSSWLKHKGNDTPTHRFPLALEGLYWSTGTSEADRSPASSPTLPRAKRPKCIDEDKKDMLRLTGSARTLISSAPVTVLSKGDTVFITRGSHRNERGKVIGQLGANAKIYKVEVAGRSGSEDTRILKIPRECISLTPPQAETPTTSAEDKTGEHPVSAPSTIALTTATLLNTDGAEEDDSLDEFFDNLSQTSLHSDAAAIAPSLSEQQIQQEMPSTESTYVTLPSSVTSLPASPLPFSPTASPKPSLGKSELPRSKIQALPGHTLSASVCIGDTVRVLQGEFQDLHGVVASSLKVTSTGLSCCVRLQGENNGSATHCLPVALLESVRAVSPAATQQGAVPG